MGGRRRRTVIPRAVLLGLLGAVLLAAGCFSPISALPGGGHATLLGGSSIPARMILVGAAASVVLVLLARRRALLITGSFSGLMVLSEFLTRQDALLPFPLEGSPARALLSSFSTEWGWGLLVLGTLLLLVAGALPGRPRRAPPSGTPRRRR
ncbi:MAG TPA: hypothetical protein PK089_02050 [Methanoregulaceae archaeon]|nr:hypothetical protein [Methanoregulaceae archaeon]HQJ88819.1 hypothetical protein [Methanoregulaceae archaeon]